MITRLVISNLFRYQNFDITLDEKLNILVGDNDAGKSTILSAIEMVLQGRLRGRPLGYEISPHWFNKQTIGKYFEDLRAGSQTEIPAIVVEAYLADDSKLARFRGKNNTLALNIPGVRLDIRLDDRYVEEYKAYVSQPDLVSTLPVELFSIDRHDFAGQPIDPRHPPVNAVLIDAANLRLESGTDYYLRRSIETHLSAEARARLSLAFRSHREKLETDTAFIAANEMIAKEQATLGDRILSLSTDATPRSSWEANLVPHLDDIPFGQIGQGEQSAFKLLLALSKSSTERQVVMVEEPENHLTYANLNLLIEKIVQSMKNDQQLLLTTHSSFVLNKLGIDKLRLLSASDVIEVKSLSTETLNYFERLPGYDTLRMLLAESTILVEGPSDELIVQKAYFQSHQKLPIADGIDVFSVGSLAFTPFLEFAKALQKPVAVITDLDDDASDVKARDRFSEFAEDNGRIRGFIGEVVDGRTLEPQLVASAGRSKLNTVLGKNYETDTELVEYMVRHKAEVALNIFKSTIDITMPTYISNAIDHARNTT